jgi:hypothetical protein
LGGEFWWWFALAKGVEEGLLLLVVVVDAVLNACSLFTFPVCTIECGE